MDTVIQAVSHIHWTQQKSRNPADKHNDLLHERWGRRYFRELYFRRGRGEVWKSKKEMQQTFHYQKKRDPRTCKVQHEETRTWCASWYIHHRLLLFVWALRIWSPSRWINLRSYHGGAAVEEPKQEPCCWNVGRWTWWWVPLYLPRGWLYLPTFLPFTADSTTQLSLQTCQRLGI